MKNATLMMAVAAVLGLTACGGTEQPSQTESTKTERAKPQPHYASIDGDEYLYQSELSENDKKNGKAMGDITAFKFNGVKDGKITLTSEDLTFTCDVACKIITVTSSLGTKERIPYAEESVVGGAFSDAMKGLLVEHPSKPATK